MKSIKTLLWAAAALAFLAGRVPAQTADDKVKQDAASATATAYTVIFDNSGSMGGKDGTDTTRIDKAKNAFNWWLSTTKPGNYWSGITFNTNNGASLLLPFTLNGQTQVATAINGLEANTNTPIVQSLVLAAQNILDARKAWPYRRYVVLLFTDGEENVDGRGNAGVTDSIRQMTQRLNIEVISIGFSSDAGDYLRNGSTKYFHADDEAGIKAGLSQVESEIDPNTPVNVTPEELQEMAHPAAHKQAAVAAPQEAPVAQNGVDTGLILKVAGAAVGLVVIVAVGKAMTS